MITWINLCVYGCPSPVYKGSRGGGGAAGQEEGAPGGVLLPPGVGFPPFPSWNRIREGERGEREGRGRRPPLLDLFGLEGEGRVAQPWPPLLSSTKAH